MPGEKELGIDAKKGLGGTRIYSPRSRPIGGSVGAFYTDTCPLDSILSLPLIARFKASYDLAKLLAPSTSTSLVTWSIEMPTGAPIPHVCIEHLPVPLKGKDEGNVDVDTFVDRLLDSRNVFVSGRDLDEDIRALHALLEPTRLFDALLGIAGDVGSDLDANIAVKMSSTFIDIPKSIRSVCDIFQHKLQEYPARISVLASASADERFHLCVVVSAVSYGLFKNGRIARHSNDADLIDHFA